MKTFFTRRVQKKILDKIKVKRERMFVSLPSAESLLFIFDMREEGIFEALLDFAISVKGMGVEIGGIAVGLKKNQEPIPKELKHEDIQLISKTETNSIGLPTCRVEAIDASKPIDILVDFSCNYNFTTDYLVRSVDAKLKVGRHVHKDNPYDIVVGARETTPFEYQQLVIRYLSLIQSA